MFRAAVHDLATCWIRVDNHWVCLKTAGHRRTPQDAVVMTAGHPNDTQMTNMTVSKNFYRSVLMFILVFRHI